MCKKPNDHEFGPMIALLSGGMSVGTPREQCREHPVKLFLLLVAVFSFAMLPSCAGFTSGQTKPAPPPSAPTAPSTPSQAQTYLNIRDYGAVGDGVHDDTPAILAAVSAAIAGEIHVVEFPPTSPFYQIGSPLVLPRSTSSWIRLHLDGPVNLGATVTVEGFYSIYGNNPAFQGQFSPDAGTAITVALGVNPAIHIVGNDVKLENLFFYFNQGGNGDGILTDDVCCITATNVSVNGQSGRDGVDVHIRGQGFGYLFEKGVYSNSGAAPTFLMEGPNDGNSVGIFTMRDVVLAGRGIQMVTHGPMTNFIFENVLFEDFQDSFLTINGASGPGAPIYNIYLNDIQMADPVGTPAAIITNHGSETSGVQILNSPIYTTAVSGDPIQDLEIWSGVDAAVGQATNYVLHEPSGIVSTMPAGAPASTRVHVGSFRPLSVKQF